MFQVLHSSAGAGKTHALVKHYIALCMETSDPGAYRSILALTFTNKAASEMKERVMGYLRKIAKSELQEGAIADVVQHLRQRTGLGNEALAQRADALLRHMLHHWSEVAISTIDAFTRRVVQPFARDLQLDHDLRMTTEQDRYLNGAVDALVATAGVDPTITSILTEACLQLLHDEQRWDPESPLRALSGELQKESSIAPLERLGDMDVDTVRAIGNGLRLQEMEFREKVRSIGREALDLLTRHGIQAGDLVHGANGIHSTFRKLAHFERNWEPPGPYARKPITSGKWHSGKASATTIAALEGLAPRLQGLFEKAEMLMAEEHPLFLMRQAVARELPATFALRALETHLERLKQEDGVAFFSDLTRKVARIVASEPVPFIYERLGERYQHYLIDEFQDTSLMQWTCLLPLVDNALSTGGSALLVGDAKQAIYRWRNGEVRLFVELPDLFGNTGTDLEIERENTLRREYRPMEALRFNRRSSPVIIDLNNSLFGALATELPEDLKSVYNGHAQEPGGHAPGLVRLEVIAEQSRGAARWEPVLDRVTQAINEALEDGAKPGDIAVLVRSAGVGGRVSQHLRSLGHAVVSPDGLRLAGDPVVELIIDVLRAAHLGDATAAARVMQYRAIISAEHDRSEVDPFAHATSLGQPMDALLAELAGLDLLSVRSTVADLLLRLCQWSGHRPAEEAALVTLLDEAHSWGVQHGSHVPAFIRHWENSGSRRSISPPQDGHAIQVMTIHKAKGLEFPVVIVPDATMHTQGANNDRIWVDPRAVAPDLEAALIKESKALVEAGVPELIEERSLRHLDDLDLLYVAFTRAAHRLYAFVQGSATDIVSKGLIRYITEQGVEGILVRGERTRSTEERANGSAALLKDVSDPSAPLQLDLRSEGTDTWSPVGNNEQAIQYGRGLHAVLAHIRTPDDLSNAIGTAIRKGELAPHEAAEAHTALYAMVHHPDLQPWFMDGAELRNEAAIVDTNGRTWRPDRVQLDKDVVRILDLKTGAPMDEHHDQVAQYIALLRQMGHPAVEGALFYLQTGHFARVNA